MSSVGEFFLFPLSARQLCEADSNAVGGSVHMIHLRMQLARLHSDRVNWRLLNALHPHFSMCIKKKTGG